MKLFEIAFDVEEYFSFDYDLTDNVIMEVYPCVNGLQLLLQNINLIQGMNITSFLIYISNYDLEQNLPVGQAFLEVYDGKIFDKIQFQVRFTSTELEIIKNFS